MRKNLILLLIVIFAASFIAKIGWGEDEKLTVVGKATSQPQTGPRFPKASERLRINEIRLGMARDEISQQKSRLDGRSLLGTRHARKGSPLELYGFTQDGDNSCTWVEFSQKGQIVGANGLSLFLDGEEIHADESGHISVLGSPSKAKTDDRGRRVVEYPQYALRVLTDEGGYTSYQLGDFTPGLLP